MTLQQNKPFKRANRSSDYLKGYFSILNIPPITHFEPPHNLYKHSQISDTGDYMFGLGTQEIILILIIVLLLFGANKLPELARSLGVSVREFKKAMKEIEEDTED